MKERISELMDDEAGLRASAGPLDALRAEGEARDTWRRYHLIGDVMRDTRIISADFSARVAARLAAEPTVMAPSRAAPARHWQLLSAAASLAAVALVGWVAFAPQGSGPQLAAVPRQDIAAKEAAQVAPPDRADDYLYAHQGYSPRNSLQGVAPYVRMVSGMAEAQKR